MLSFFRFLHWGDDVHHSAGSHTSLSNLGPDVGEFGPNYGSDKCCSPDGEPTYATRWKARYASAHWVTTTIESLRYVPF